MKKLPNGIQAYRKLCDGGHPMLWLHLFVKKYLIPFFCFFVLLHQGVAQKKTALNQAYRFPYQLDKPDSSFSLPMVLEEISGLSLGPDTSSLLAINDEEGVVYILDRHSGAVLEYKSFWKDGDYEGLEWTDSTLWVIKSNGKLYEVRNFTTDSLCTEKHLTPLSKENDVEGLGYDPSQRRLLIAAKGAAMDSVRYFFSYMLHNCDICFVSLFQISRRQILEYVAHLPEGETKKQLQEQFDAQKEKFKFKPSAIATHPQTGEFYILASAGKLLMVCSPDGSILHIQKLNKQQHRQPEGLCFAQDGTLYIANEADGKKARLFVFRMQ